MLVQLFVSSYRHYIGEIYDCSDLQHFPLKTHLQAARASEASRRETQSGPWLSVSQETVDAFLEDAFDAISLYPEAVW